MNGVLIIFAGVLLLFVVISGKTHCIVQCFRCLTGADAPAPAA